MVHLVTITMAYTPDELICGRCHRQMRESSVPAGDAPGTVAAHAKKLCSTCYRAARRWHGWAGTDANPALLAWRRAFEADRRARGIPVDGTMGRDPRKPRHD